MKKLALVSGLVILLLFLGCASSGGIDAPDWFLNPVEEEGYLFGKATATSRDLQLSIDKAKQDARLDVASNLESHIQGLIKKFDEEVGRTEESELLSQFTKVSKNVVDESLVGTRVRKNKIKRVDGMYRAFVLVELPIGKARAELLDQINDNEHLYTRFRASQSFKELEKEIQNLREYEEEQREAYEGNK